MQENRWVRLFPCREKRRIGGNNAMKKMQYRNHLAAGWMLFLYSLPCFSLLEGKKKEGI